MIVTPAVGANLESAIGVSTLYTARTLAPDGVVVALAVDEARHNEGTITPVGDGVLVAVHR